MKKFLKYGLIVIGAVIALYAVLYFLFPETLFRLMIKGQMRSAGLVRKEIQVDDHRIAYLEGGKGETIVLLHGFGACKEHWLPFAARLKGYRLVIPDVPGFGESSQVKTARYDMESQVRRLDRFVEALQIKKFHLAGQSMSGAIAATYGARYPGKPLSLALMDPAGAPSPRKSEMTARMEKGENLLLADDIRGYDELMAMIFVKPPAVPDNFKRIMIADMAARREFNMKILQDWRPERFSLAPVLPLITAPVLIIWGDQDKITDIGGIAFLQKYLKKSDTAVIKDSGHAPTSEKPEETAGAYLDFLSKKG